MDATAGIYPLSQVEIERGLQRLPPLSASVTKLLELTQRDEVTMERLAHTIAQDPALSVRMLRIANSPFFGLAGEVISISQACVVLGVNAVRNIAVAVGVGSCFNVDGPGADEQRRLWRLAINRAVAAQTLARCCGFNKDTAFTAGTLHDLGKMAMNSCFADAMQELYTYRELHDCDMATAEQAIFGMDHREIGRILAVYWALPELIQQIVSVRLEESNGCLGTLADIVILADAASVAAFSDSPEELITSLPETAVQRLGLDAEALNSWLEDVEANRDTMELLI